jgi:hypothetical protein
MWIAWIGIMLLKILFTGGCDGSSANYQVSPPLIRYQINDSIFKIGKDSLQIYKLPSQSKGN